MEEREHFLNRSRARFERAVCVAAERATRRGERADASTVWIALRGRGDVAPALARWRRSGEARAGLRCLSPAGQALLAEAVAAVARVARDIADQRLSDEWSSVVAERAQLREAGDGCEQRVLAVALRWCEDALRKERDSLAQEAVAVVAACVAGKAASLAAARN